MPGLLVFLVELDAEGFQLGDVGVVVVGDVRDHHPVAVQVGAADLLDARQVLALDRAELGEVDLRPGQQAERLAAAARRRLGRQPPWCWPRPLITALVKPWTSSCVMRPLGPLPFTSSSGTPSSRANLRTDGEACGRLPVGAPTGRAAASAAVGDVRCGRRRRAAGSPLRPAGAAGAGAAPLPVRRAPRRAFEHRDQVADVDLVAELDLEFLDHAGRGRRNLHRRLVRFDRDQRLLELDRVAGLDQQLDDRDVLEVADVRDLDFDRPGSPAAAAAAGGSWGRRGGASSPRPCGGRAGAGAGQPGAEGAAAVVPSSTTRTDPSFTLSPSLTFSSLTTPAGATESPSRPCPTRP